MRFKVDVDPKDDVVVIHDEEEKLKTSFDSDVLLSPVEDALPVVLLLNQQDVIIKVLYEALSHFEDEQDIDYWISEAVEDLEDVE